MCTTCTHVSVPVVYVWWLGGWGGGGDKVYGSVLINACVWGGFFLSIHNYFTTVLTDLLHHYINASGLLSEDIATISTATCDHSVNDKNKLNLVKRRSQDGCCLFSFCTASCRFPVMGLPPFVHVLFFFLSSL